ncbi:hypothetical protein, partial [Escherichia sp. 8.2195]|uniref:hypothetical protein n=1 Tax=Escherichia sp. 8.2195 TaxID=2723303 RepID=UPI001A919FA5
PEDRHRHQPLSRGLGDVSQRQKNIYLFLLSTFIEVAILIAKFGIYLDAGVSKSDSDFLTLH